jgi:hypothetical protein
MEQKKEQLQKHSDMNKLRSAVRKVVSNLTSLIKPLNCLQEDTDEMLRERHTWRSETINNAMILRREQR